MLPTTAFTLRRCSAFFRAGFSLLLALGLTFAAFAAEAKKVSFDVPAGEAADSLKRLASQASQQVVYPAADLMLTLKSTGESACRLKVKSALSTPGARKAFRPSIRFF